jgi:hypothetical protein
LFEIGGTIAFISRLGVAKGTSDGKLELCVTAGRPELDGGLLGTEFPNVSEASAAEGTRGRVDGAKELGGIKFRELELAGGIGDGTSGKFEAPVGIGALKLGYCIGCCIEGGIDSPGGGRSKDC